MYNKFIVSRIIFNFKKCFHLKILIIICFIFIINIKEIYSYESNGNLFYTYENITDYLIFANKFDLDKCTAVYDKNKTLNKTEVLKIKNVEYLSYYCRNDICVQVKSGKKYGFVEIPDKNGNIKRYISRSCTYDNLKSANCIEGKVVYYEKENKLNQIIISFRCISDSQCLTNKCINNICIFNEKNPYEYCSNIYRFSFILGGGRSYMYCGKEVDDICKNNNDCGTKHCIDKRICGEAHQPSESDGLGEIIILMYLFFIFIILCCCYCIYFIIKHRRKIIYIIKCLYHFMYNLPWIFYFLIFVFFYMFY